MSALFENLIVAWVRTKEEISPQAAPTVRSALESIHGVRSASVCLSGHQLDVSFDLNRVNLTQFERALFVVGFTLDEIVIRFAGQVDKHLRRGEGRANL